MFSQNIDYFKEKPSNMSKIIVLLDNGYHPSHTTIRKTLS